MANTEESSAVIEVTASNFDELVIEASHQRPVLADFWAPWCGPCRTLTPVLERIVDDPASGGLQLAKINSDHNPQLAARYRIQGIPAVLLFKSGDVVDRFVGALPEAKIREFLRPHCPSEVDLLVQKGLEYVAAHNLDQAGSAFHRALELDQRSAPARLGLAQIAFARGELEMVADHVAEIPIGSDQFDQGQGLIEAAQLIREAIALDDPAEIGTTFTAGGHALADGDYQRALDSFLKVVELDHLWNRQAGKRAMLVVFKLVGVRDPLSDQYRDRLRGLLSR